jgi:hypothetical protein
MKLKEILEKHDITTDSKTRRKANSSKKVANITADEIENGVTLERLKELNVPVYQYTTQITIHGSLPKFNERARPAGYKSIVKNGNGTVGVRYVAIDAEKKKRLVEIGHYCRGNFIAIINSKGLTASAVFHDKEEFIKAYKMFPRDLFAGSVIAASGFFGEYYIIAEIGAIPTENFGTLVHYLFGVTEEEFERVKAERDAAYRKEREQASFEAKKRAENVAKLKSSAFNDAASSINLTPLKSIPEIVGSRFVTLQFDITKGIAKPIIVVVTKKVFGKPYISITTYDGNNGNWIPGKEEKSILLDKRRSFFTSRLEEGHVWSLSR